MDYKLLKKLHIGRYLFLIDHNNHLDHRKYNKLSPGKLSMIQAVESNITQKDRDPLNTQSSSFREFRSVL